MKMDKVDAIKDDVRKMGILYLIIAIINLPGLIGSYYTGTISLVSMGISVILDLILFLLIIYYSYIRPLINKEKVK